MLGRSKKLILLELMQFYTKRGMKQELNGTCQLSGLPKGINDRQMTLRLPLSDNKRGNIVSAHVPIMTNTAEAKYKFYNTTAEAKYKFYNMTSFG